MEDADWQLLYETIAHGEQPHRDWLRGMVAGFASAHEGRRIAINDSAPPKP